MRDPNHDEAPAAEPRSAPEQPSRSSVPENSRLVDRSSKESFPASDPPAWTPIVSSAPPATVSDEEASAWRAEGATVHERSTHWAQHAIALLDAGRYGAFCAAHLAEDVLCRVGSDLQMSGRTAVREWLEGVLSSSGRSTHRITGITAEEHAIVVEADATYFRDGEPPAIVAEAWSFRLRGDRASRLQLYMSPRTGG